MLLKLPDFFIQQRCVNLTLLEGLKAELPLYLSKADSVCMWQSHEKELPRLSNACKQMVFYIEYNRL